MWLERCPTEPDRPRGTIEETVFPKEDRNMIRTIGLTATIAWSLSSVAAACPFCSAVSQTLSEEIASMDAVVIARLVQAPPAKKDGSGTPTKVVFQIDEILKGKSHLRGQRRIELLYYGKAEAGDRFLIQGVDPPELMWSTPLKLTPRAIEYVKALPKLPPKGPQRLAFFWKHLEDREDWLARDAYDEYARAPYDAVKAAKEVFDHDQLIEWIRDGDIPASRRRLYFTLLGVCGSKADNPLLEQLLRSSEKKDKAGLDALAACYLTINGAEGLPLLEELYLANTKADYAETYSVIQAIQFHGTSAKLIPKERLLVSLRLVLDRPAVADLVIPNLARWQDWSQIDRLAELFRKADEKTTYVRLPIASYLLACPLPQAKKRLEELEKIDPGAIRRARTFLTFGTDTNQ